jgi:hypothetical protein
VPINDLAGGQGSLHVINAPGSYYLSGNIGSSGLDGVRIDTPGPVFIDGMGFTMSGTGGGSAIYLVDHADQAVHIENTHFVGWDYHMYDEPSPVRTHFRGGSASWVRTSGTGAAQSSIWAPEMEILISFSSIGSSGQDGVVVGDNSTINSSNIGSSGLDGVVGGHDLSINHSAINGNSCYGVRAGSGMVIKGSKIKENLVGGMIVEDDVVVDGNIITGHVIAGANAHFEEGYFDGYIVAGKGCTLIDTNIHMGIEPTPFVPIQLLGGGHHVRGNTIVFDSLSTTNIPAMIVKGDSVEVANNHFEIRPAAPGAATVRNPPHWTTWDGRGYDFQSNTWQGLPAGTEAAMLLGERHVVEHSIISADDPTAQGFIGGVNHSVFRSNLFMNITAPNAFPLTGVGNYIAPLVDAGSAATSSKCDVNVVIEPTP